MSSVFTAVLGQTAGAGEFIDPDTGATAPISLNALSLSATSFPAGSSVGTVIGTLSGVTFGSSLQITAVSTANAATLSTISLLVGSGAPNPSAGASNETFTVTIRETLIGATNSPRTTILTVTIVAPAAVTTTLTTEAVGAATRAGIRVATLDAGASLSGTNANHFDVSAAGAVTVSDIGEDALSGPYTLTVTGDDTYTTLVIPVETGNVLDITDWTTLTAAMIYAAGASRTTDWIIRPRNGTVIDGGASATNFRALSNTAFPSSNGALRGQVTSGNIPGTALATPSFNASTGVVSGTAAAYRQVVVHVNGVQYPRSTMADRNGAWSLTLAPNPGGTPTLTATSYETIAPASRNINDISTMTGGSYAIEPRQALGATVSTSMQFQGIGPIRFKNLDFTRVSQNPVQDTDKNSGVAFNTASAEPFMLRISALTSSTGSAEYYPPILIENCHFGSATSNVDAYNQCVFFHGDRLIVQDSSFERFWRALYVATGNVFESKRNLFRSFTNDVIDCWLAGYYPQHVGRRCLISVIGDTVCKLTEALTQTNNHSDWLQLGASNPLIFTTNSTSQNVQSLQTTSASENNADAWRAFDVAGTTEWRASTAGTQWIQWQRTSGTPGNLTIYTIRSSLTDAASSAPKAWTVQCSMDGSTWTTVDTQTNQTGWANGETRYFFCPPYLPAYTYIRWVFTSADNAATPVCVSTIAATLNYGTGQVIEKLVCDNLCVMAAEAKLQATQADESDHSILPINGHMENNFIVFNMPTGIRMWWSDPLDKGLTVTRNTLIQSRASLLAAYPAPYNSLGSGTNDVAGGIIAERGTGAIVTNNITPSIWDDHAGGAQHVTDAGTRTIGLIGGTFTSSGNIYSQCYKRNTGDGLSYPEIFSNQDSVLTYKEPTADELAITATAKVGWQWWQQMPTDSATAVREWLVRNFTPVGLAANKGWGGTAAQVPGPVSDPGITAVRATGWDVDYTSPPTMDPVGAPRYLVASRAGYTNLGVATTYTESIVLTQRVRQIYPNHASLDASRVALADYVYSTDTITGVTNNSTETSPQPIARLARPDHAVIGDTLPPELVEVVAAHRNARNGEEVACVTWSATNGTTTVTASSSTAVVSGHEGDRQAVLVYRPTAALNTSGFADGATVTVTISVYPWIGGPASVRTLTAVFLKHTAKFSNPPIAVLSPSGSDTNGVISTIQADADAAPFATLAGVIAAAKNNASIGNVVDGLRVYVQSGGVGLGTSVAAGTYSGQGEMVVTRHPSVTRANAVFNYGATNLSNRLGYIRYKDLTLVRQGMYYLGGASSTALEAVNLDLGGFSGGTWASSSAGVGWVLGATISNPGAGGTFNTGAAENKLLRGLDYRTATTAAMGAEIGCVIGCYFENGSINSAPATRPLTNVFVGFNRFMKQIQNTMNIGTTANDINGAAFVQNLYEYISTTNNPLLRISSDGSLANTTHVVIHHETTTGNGDLGRYNLAYDEAAGTSRRNHRLWSVVGVLANQLNVKGDVFVGVNQGNADAPNRTGHMAFHYGVGFRGLITQYPCADGFANGTGAAFGQAYAGADAVNAAAASSINPLWTAPAHVTRPVSTLIAGAGGGTYTLQTGSPALGKVSNRVVKFDLAGTTRPASAASGAYET
jgi:hypothetical protein